MSQLERIINLFPEGGPAKPTPEVIAKICAIDEAIHATRAELELVLNKLEDANRGNWRLGKELSWKRFEGTPFARFPEYDEEGYKDPETLFDIHGARHQTVLQIFADQNVVVEDGGLKTFVRSKNKLDRRRELGMVDRCPDLSRVRLVVQGLAGLDDAHERLLVHMPPLLQLLNINHYSAVDMMKRYQTPFRGVLTSWCSIDAKNTNHEIATEVQLVTERVRAILDLDHPFNVAQVLQYPDEQAKDYIYSLMLKSSILDFQEQFAI